jgi:hypothetical protein
MSARRRCTCALRSLRHAASLVPSLSVLTLCFRFGRHSDAVLDFTTRAKCSPALCKRVLSPRFLPQVNHPFSLQHVEFLLHFPRNFSRRSLVPWGNSMRQPKTSKTAVPATSSLHLSSLPPRIPLKLTTRTPAPTAAVTAAGVTAGLSRTSCSRDRVLACSRVRVFACSRARVFACSRARVFACLRARVLACSRVCVLACSRARVFAC